MLENELKIYRQNMLNFLKQGQKGKFVVIKDTDIMDVFVTYEDALRQGLKRYGNTAFLIKKINEFEEINFFFQGVDIPLCQASA